MIKRTYFFSVQCPKHDGNGSYSFWSTTVTVKTFLAQPSFVLEQLTQKAKTEFQKKGIESPSLDIQAFNRI